MQLWKQAIKKRPKLDCELANFEYDQERAVDSDEQHDQDALIYINLLSKVGPYSK